MIGVVRDKFFHSLKSHERQWLAYALVGMIVADKDVDEDELQYFEQAVNLVETRRDVETLALHMEDFSRPEMWDLELEDRRKAYILMSLLSTVLLSDGNLSRAELAWLNVCGARLGFAETMIAEIAKLNQHKLAILNKEQELIEKSERII